MTTNNFRAWLNRTPPGTLCRFLPKRDGSSWETGKVVQTNWGKYIYSQQGGLQKQVDLRRVAAIEDPASKLEDLYGQ